MQSTSRQPLQRKAEVEHGPNPEALGRTTADGFFVNHPQTQGLAISSGF